MGAKTKKMFLGHRGANHPVKNLKNGLVEITVKIMDLKLLKIAFQEIFITILRYLMAV